MRKRRLWSLQLVGPLPGELGGVTLFAAGIGVSCEVAEPVSDGLGRCSVFKSKGTIGIT
jgi:hypothetical protein